MRIIGAIAIVAAMGGAAVAGPKPTVVEARRTVEAWRAELGDRDDPAPAALVALTATPFQAYVWDDEGSSAAGDGELCKHTTATDAAGVASALQCIEANTNIDGTYKLWTKQVAREDGIPHGFKKELRALAKTATLVMVEQDCAGTGTQAVFAVTKDAGGALKVSAMLATSYFCGE